MKRMHIAFAAGLAIAALAVAGCGGSSNNEATSTATETTTSTEGTTAAATGTKLIGTVGTADDANAFVITLTTADGAAVTTLTPGDYTLEIKDLSTIHDFHLTGTGVDVSSDVGTTEDKNYPITLTDGTYTFMCDPHSSSMNGSFEVSG
jgi:plastocyanin